MSSVINLSKETSLKGVDIKKGLMYDLSKVI